MSTVSHSPTRARLTAAALATGALMLAAVTLTSPWQGSVDQVATVRQQGGAIMVNALLWFGASLLLISAGAGIAGAVRGRGGSVALTGAIIVGTATTASATVAGLESVSVSLASSIDDDAALRQALGSFETDPVLTVVFILWLLGSAVGWPLLFVGAARGGLIPWWLAVPVGVAMVGQVVATTDSLLVNVPLVAAFVIPCLVLSVRLARQAAPVAATDRPVAAAVAA